MTWTTVDLAVIAGILDTLSVDPMAADLAGAHLRHARLERGDGPGLAVG